VAAKSSSKIKPKASREAERAAAEQPQQEHDRLAQPVDQEEAPRLPFPVVGIGASAGGLEAFIEFFEAMPADPGMAFVLVQHLSPDRESLIAEILTKHSKLPVHEIKDRMEVEANRVYVIRPGHTLTIKDGLLHLGETLKKPGHNRPVDDFFRSLAEEQRERAICIIMSGMGSNGTGGTEAIKAVGGMAIAQDPETAKFPSMPRHLVNSGNADFVLGASEMPEMLLRYVAHPYVSEHRPPAPQQSEEEQLQEILTILRARTHRDFSGYKKPTLLRRIHRRMGLAQIDSFIQYAKFLRQNLPEVSALSDDLMIHVTGFFRDPDAWEALRQRVIDPLVAERTSDSTIRCWVSACSTGEEAYTLAMVLTEAAEAAEAAGKKFDIKVFATDTADRTLAKARHGAYPLGIESDVSAERLERFFERDDAMYRASKELRELVLFAPQNVTQDPPFSRLDLCTCRNLLIYLEPDLQRRVLSFLHFGLRGGGALMLGTSETVSGADDLFEQIDKRARIYRRVGPVQRDALDFAFPADLGRDGDGQEKKAVAVPKVTVVQVANKVLLDRHTPAAVVVDRQLRVSYFHGKTEEYLSHPPGEPTRDLIALAREQVRGAVRLVVHKAMAEGQAATSRDGIIENSEGRFRIEVTAAPLDGKLLPGNFLITFDMRKETSLPPAESQAVADDDATRLREELNRVRDELQGAIEELQTSNEEQRASNEEAMSINEELQSTNEELQTSKEELQSLNEELATVNSQLQVKIEEHEAASSDLSSLLSSTDIAVVFLDPKMRIRRFTPAVSDLIEIIPSDVGRPLSDLARKFADATLLADCKTVLEKLAPIEREVRSATDRVYARRVLPYRTSNDRIEGVVITFVDVTERKRIEEAVHEMELRFRSVLEGAPDFAILLMDKEGRIVTWNVGAERLLGWRTAEVIGKSAAITFPPELGDPQLLREMRFWSNGVLTAVHDNAGELTGFVKVLRDDTPRREAEAGLAELLEREKAAREEAEHATQLKDQFLATLSHELRTPLSAILVWAKMLRQDLVDESEWQEGFEVIERSAEAQRQLLDDLLDTSRIATGKVRLERTDVNVQEVVRTALEVVAPFAKEKNITLKTHTTDESPEIFADPHRLQQVVANLLNNAVKFTPSGGSVEVRLAKRDAWLELTVSDTGRGIEPDMLSQVFTAFMQADPSSTRQFGGLGLGLAISKELVELHGGTIHAESGGKNQGATFILRLPMLARPTKPKPKTLRPLKFDGKTASTVPLSGTHVLWVEDEPQTRDALTKLLAKAGAQVTAVTTAAAAFEAFEKARPDLIVSDIGLPGEDGYQLMQHIRTLEAENGEAATPAIALTAFASGKDRRQAHESGYHKHLAKPVAPAALIAAVTTLLDEKDRHENGN
jgi:two-component system CheB/CheR fusion protein